MLAQFNLLVTLLTQHLMQTFKRLLVHRSYSIFGSSIGRILPFVESLLLKGSYLCQIEQCLFTF